MYIGIFVFCSGKVSFLLSFIIVFVFNFYLYIFFSDIEVLFNMNKEKLIYNYL